MLPTFHRSANSARTAIAPEEKEILWIHRNKDAFVRTFCRSYTYSKLASYYIINMKNKQKEVTK